MVGLFAIRAKRTLIAANSFAESIAATKQSNVPVWRYDVAQHATKLDVPATATAAATTTTDGNEQRYAKWI